MKDRFDTVIWPFIARHEGGFTSKLNDGAGDTAYGITQNTLDALWRLDKLWMQAQSMPASTRQLSKDQAWAIARRFYWEKPDLQLLPAPVDLVVVDWYFHGGPALKTLNRLTGLQRNTITAQLVEAASINPWSLADQLVKARRAYLQGLKTWPRFSRNWALRLDDLQSAIV